MSVTLAGAESVKAVAPAMGVAPAALGNGWIGKIWKPPAVPAGNLGVPSTES